MATSWGFGSKGSLSLVPRPSYMYLIDEELNERKGMQGPGDKASYRARVHVHWCSAIIPQYGVKFGIQWSL